MKTASKLLSVAFAVAAIAVVAMPSAHTAEAANGPDLKVTIDNVQAGAGSKVHIWGTIKNVGNAQSGPIMFTPFCGYWLDQDGVKEVAAQLMETKPALAAGAEHTNFSADFYCSAWNGHYPIYYRMAAMTPGDTNLSNNEAKRLTFGF